MKYVVFRRRGVLMPVIFADHIVHNSVRIVGAVPVSAGHFHLDDSIPVISDKESESMGIGPDRSRDQDLIRDTLNNSGVYAFTPTPDGP